MPQRKLELDQLVSRENVCRKHLTDAREMIFDCVSNDPSEFPLSSPTFSNSNDDRYFGMMAPVFGQFSPIRFILFGTCQTIELRVDKLWFSHLVHRGNSGKGKKLPFFKRIFVPLESLKPYAAKIPAVIFDGQKENHPVRLADAAGLLPEHFTKNRHRLSFGHLQIGNSHNLAPVQVISRKIIEKIDGAFESDFLERCSPFGPNAFTYCRGETLLGIKGLLCSVGEGFTIAGLESFAEMRSKFHPVPVLDRWEGFTLNGQNWWEKGTMRE